jgi:hypothetical protein
MAKRQIWWVRWSEGYKPVSWKGWTALGTFCAALWPILKVSEWLSRLAGFQNERLLGAVAVVIFWFWFGWFVERYTAKRK